MGKGAHLVKEVHDMLFGIALPNIILLELRQFVFGGYGSTATSTR